MRSAAEAVAYAKKLHELVQWIDICDGNMQEGSFRCDVNVSVRPKGTEKLGTRREIKNLNSFKFMQQAIEYETRWQIETLEDGVKIEQATVLFNPDIGETRAMRSKEEANDYRYFPDPDLLPLEVTEADKARVKLTMPELPEAMKARFVNDYQLSNYDASMLTSTKAMAEYFEVATNRILQVNPAGWRSTEEAKQFYGKMIGNGISGLLVSQLNREGLEIRDSIISPLQFAELHVLLVKEIISSKTARDVFTIMWEDKLTGEYAAAEVVESKGLKQVSDSGAIEAIIDEVLAANQAMVEEFKAGKEKAFNALVGQCMKASKGKANPAQVNEILKKKLAN
jgi:aspartyl-tRNA(Asn)/glutamyl-tRNA(Gln) amidotransferase subunit B